MTTPRIRDAGFLKTTVRMVATAGLLATAAGTAWPQRTALSPEDLYEQLAPSVWLVETRDVGGKGSLGSAVVIAPTELITNCHVVDKAEVIAVSHGGPRIRARLRYKDPERDLCQLTAEGLASPIVEVAPESTLRVGAKVYALGNPSGMLLTLSDGLLSGLRRDRDGKLQAVQMTVPISPGSSGGGVFDVHGRLIGVATFTLRETQNLNFALPAGWIAELPRRAGGDDLARNSRAATPARPPMPPMPPMQAAPALPPHPPQSTPEPAPGPANPDTETPANPGPERVAASGFTYQLRDRAYRTVRQVTFRSDGRVEGDAGDFVAAMPPGGWVTNEPKPGNAWSLEYRPPGTGAVTNMKLRAQVLGETSLRVNGRELRVVPVEFTGETARAGGVGATNHGVYRATAWFAPQLGRIARFEARTRGGVGAGVFVVDEELVLVNILSD